MQQPFLGKLKDLWDSLIRSGAGSALSYIAIAAAVILVLWIVWRLIRSRRRPSVMLLPDLTISIDELGVSGPPAGMPTLELYNLPVRLAAVVLAPVGRVGELPSENATSALLEAVIPGLDKIAASHRPLVRRWPGQVSARGFAHLFFANVKLPGEGGKGTPWASVAGVFKQKGKPVMAALVLRAESPNSLGQTIIEKEHEWLGCLRVRWS